MRASSSSSLLEMVGLSIGEKHFIQGGIAHDIRSDGRKRLTPPAINVKTGVISQADLSDTGIPRVNVAAGASGDEEFLQFDTSKVPVIVTLTKVGKHYIVDATSEEESQMSSAVSISLNRQGHICGLTKRGGAGLDPSIILDMVSVAETVSEQLINTLDSQIAAAEAGEDEL